MEGKRNRKEKGTMYRGFHFFFDSLAGAVDCVAGSSEGDFSLGVVGVALGGDINSASG